MDTSLSNVEFLSRSVHRHAALEALIERPHDRADLRESIGASSSTIGRVIDDLEAKGWITRIDHHYEVTQVGKLVGGEFARLLETMEAVEQLQEVIDWLPTEQMEFDITTLQDANITTATQSSPFIPILRMADSLGTASHIQMLASSVIPPVLTAVRDAVVNEAQTFEAVIPAGFLDDVSAETDMRTQIQEILDSSQATVLRSDSEVPYTMAIADETLLIEGTDEQGIPRALIETTNRSAVAWAESVYTSRRSDAERIGPSQVVA